MDRAEEMEWGPEMRSADGVTELGVLRGRGDELHRQEAVVRDFRAEHFQR